MAKQLATIFLLFINAILFGQSFRLDNISVKEGLPSNCVYACTQDTLGFMWFATSAGLVIYDGVSFKKMEGHKDLALYLRTDQHSRVYAYTFNGINVYEDYQYDEKLSSKIQFTSVAKYHFFEETPDKLYFENVDTTYIVSSNNLSLLSKKAIQFPIVNRYSPLTSLFQIDTFFRTHNAVFRLSLSKLLDTLSLYHSFATHEIFAHNIKTKKTELLANNNSTINCFIDKDYMLWTCTNDGLEGLSLKEHKDKLKLLPGKIINNIFEDKEGNLWICTRNDGLYLLKNKNIYTFEINTAQTPEAISYIKANANATQIIGYNRGAYSLMQNNQISPIIKLSVTNVFNRIKYSEKINNQLVVYTDNGIFINNKNVDSKTFCIKAVAELDSDIRVISNCYGLFLFSLRKLSVIDTLFRSRTNAVCISKDNTIWFADANHIFNYNKGVQEFFSFEKKEVNIVSILADEDRNLWVSTINNGVYLFNADAKIIKVFNKDDGIISNICYTLSEDWKQRIWIGTEKGISIIDKQNQYAIVNATESEGLLTGEINCISNNKDTAWIGVNYGIMKYIYTAPIPHKESVRIAFQSISVNNKNVEINKQNLQPEENNIKLNLNCFYFKGIKNIRIRYTLYSENKVILIDTTGDFSISFNSLRPNKYKLIIQAYHIYDPKLTSNTLKWEFKIDDYFYKKLWFIVLCALSFTVIATLITLKFSSLKKEKENTELRIKSKMNELSMQALQSQMNPHFIFNALNSVQYFISQNNNHKAFELIEGFSKLMREILKNSKENAITLQQEIAFLKNYVALESLRFGKTIYLNITIHLEEDIEDIVIPPMLIQPLVENAIKHGINTLNREHNEINCRFSLINKNILQVLVVNPTGTISSYNKNNHLSSAINIIRQRVKLISINNQQGEFELLIEKEMTTAKLLIPIA
jgi:sensor histidine kinase YesM